MPHDRDEGTYLAVSMDRRATLPGMQKCTPVPNVFAGGQWTYTLDPVATFAGTVVINEIMFNARGGLREHAQ